MYLRLKGRQATPLAWTADPQGGSAGLAALHRRLEQNHFAAFDWRHGGPPGPVKFVDAHQLEFAGMLALEGDDRSRLMLQRYASGIRRLLDDHAGAAQYATGVGWQTPCRLRTLAGQAHAVQALAVAGRVTRSCTDFHSVNAIATFVAARWRRPVESRASAMCRADGVPWRDRAWYASAMLGFAHTYGAEVLHRVARDAFAGLENALGGPGAALAETHVDDAVALAGAARDFAIAEGRPDWCELSRTLTLAVATRAAHPEGGWGQPPWFDGQPCDIDVTIDLVRIANSLSHTGDPALERIVADGRRALFAPQTALARMPESGLLLLGRGRRPHWRDSPGRNRQRMPSAAPIPAAV